MTTTINTTILTDLLYRSAYGHIQFVSFRTFWCGRECEYSRPLSARSIEHYLEQGMSEQEITRIEAEHMLCYGHERKSHEQSGMLRSFRCLPERNTLILDFLPWNKDEQKLSSKTRVTYQLDQLELWDNHCGLRFNPSRWDRYTPWTEIHLSQWYPR